MLVLAFAAVVAEVAIYYALPFNRDVTWRTSVWFFLGLVAFGVVLFVQISQIMKSPYPRLRAVVAIMVSLPVFLLMFASAYFLAGRTSSAAFTEHLSRTDALYFSVTVFSTVGFGDISPTEQSTRVLATFQMLGDVIIVGLFGRVIVGAVGVGMQRQPGPLGVQGPEASSPPDDER